MLFMVLGALVLGLQNRWQNFVWVLAHGVRELIRPSPAIRHPALVITCENDTGSTPDMSNEIATEIAGAQSLIVPKLKHLGMMEDPEAFTAPILKFLNAQPFS